MDTLLEQLEAEEEEHKPRRGNPNFVKGNRCAEAKRLEIEWRILAKLCAIHCTLDEIACVLECSPDTIERACLREQGMGFTDFYDRHQGEGKASLRHMQWQTASGSDAVYLKDKRGRKVYNKTTGEPIIARPARVPHMGMQVFLGKNILGQKDVTDIKGEFKHSLKAEDMTDEQLAGIAGSAVEEAERLTGERSSRTA